MSEKSQPLAPSEGVSVSQPNAGGESSNVTSGSHTSAGSTTKRSVSRSGQGGNGLSPSRPSGGQSKPTDPGNKDGFVPTGKSPVGGSPVNDGESVSKPGSNGRSVATAAAGASAAAAPVVATATLTTMLMTWLKGMLFSAAAVVANLGSSVLGLIGGALSKVAGMFTGAVAKVGSFLGGLIPNAVIGTVAASVAAVGVVATGSALTQPPPAKVDDKAFVKCSTAATADVASSLGASGLDANAQKEDMAKRVYAVLAGMGMPKENIAGILGNWDAESGIDPTSVETIFSEPYHLGPQKKKAEAAGFSIRAYNPTYGARFPAIKQSGIGLGQWTNERNVLLRNYAKKVNKPWYEIETQLGFMFVADTRPDVMKKMVSTPLGSPSEATAYFMAKWEGISDHSGGKRQKSANEWFARMSNENWATDKALADSILSQAGGSFASANLTAVSDAVDDCKEASSVAGGNSSIADAMVAYSYATTAEGRGNNGTPLYQFLHNKIFPGDPWYMSCDRSVAVAVVWSGADDTFPPGAVRHQMAYMDSSDKWERVPWNGDKSQLQPGDLMARNGGGVSHIVMYVGQEAVQKVHGSKAAASSEIASGSLNTRSPGIGNFYGQLTTYTVWRNVKPEPNPKWKNLRM